MAENKYDVLLVEDDPSCRQRLTQVIEAHSALTLLADVGSVQEAMGFMGSSKPDVLIVDIGLPDGSGIDLIRHCKSMPGETACLVVSIYGDEQHVLEALAAGATGYLLKEAPLIELGEAILSAVGGDAPISPRIAKALLQQFQPDEGALVSEVDENQLTSREEEVLGFLAKGFTRAEIAKKMDISINTVGAHIKHTYQKLEVNSGSKAVYKARQYGLIKGE